MSKPFWCSRLTNPSKLKNHFSEVYSEMMLSLNMHKKDKKEINKEYAKNLLLTIKNKIPSRVKIEGYNNYVEILVEGSSLATTIAYTDNGFKDQFENALRKYGIKFD